MIDNYNRAIVLAGTQNLRVENNNIFKVNGHAIALEEGNEEGNVFSDNWVVAVKKAYSFMTSDSQPAAFYITNPNNVVTNNFVHATERYGFWYHLQDSVAGSA